ncbi:MAG: hypothetical protein QGH40_02040, partial [bacterium]|nr:hypothetical protein [bacterium]
MSGRLPKIDSLMIAALLISQLYGAAAALTMDQFDRQARRHIETLEWSRRGDGILSAGDRESLRDFSRTRSISMHDGTERRIDLTWIKRTLDDLDTVKGSGPKARRLRRQYTEVLGYSLDGFRRNVLAAPAPSDLTSDDMRRVLDEVTKETTRLPAGQEADYSRTGTLLVGDKFFAQDIEGEITAMKRSGSGSDSSSGFTRTTSGSRGGTGGSSGYSSTDGSSSAGSSFSSGQTSSKQSRSNPVRTTGRTSSSRRTTRPVQVNKTGSKTSRPTIKPKREKKNPVQKKKPKPKPRPKKPQSKKHSMKALMKIVYWIIVALTLLFVFGLVVYIYQSIQKNINPKQRQDSMPASPLPPELDEPQKLYLRAREAARKGQVTLGIRLMTMACLLLLDEK